MLVQLHRPLTQVDPELALLRKWYVGFLGHAKQYVRRFAAEAVAPVWRKLERVALAKQIKMFVKSFVGKMAAKRDAEQQKQVVDGVALLFFNLIKSVGHDFHSCCAQVLPVILRAGRPVDGSDTMESLEQREVFRVLQQMMQYVREYTRRGKTQVVWDCIIMEFKRSLRKGNMAHAGQCCSMLVGWLEHRNHSRVEVSTERLLLQAVVEPLLLQRPMLPVVFKLLLAIRKSAQHHKDTSSAEAAEKAIVENIVKDDVDREVQLQFLSGILEEAEVHGEVDFLQAAVVRLCEEHVESKPVEHLQLLHRYSQRVAHVFQPNEVPSLRLHVAKVLSNWNTTERLEVEWSIRVFAAFGESSELNAFVMRNSLPDDLFVLCLTVVCTNATSTAFHEQLLARAMQRIPQSLDDGHFLMAFAKLLELQPTDSKVELEAKQMSLLIANVRHQSRSLRLASLGILCAPPTAPEWADRSIVQELQRLEEMPVEFQHERERRAALARLEARVLSTALHPHMVELIGCFCLGQLHVKYKPLWAMVRSLLQTLVQTDQGFLAVWPHLETHVGQVVRRSCREDDNSQSTQPVDLFESTFKLLAALPTSVGARSRQLLPLFFSFLLNEYAGDSREEPELQEALSTVATEAELSKSQCCADSSRKECGRKLEMWLRVVSSWSNLRSAWRAQELKRVLVVLLSKARPNAVPSLCLSALFAYKDPGVIEFKESLKGLTSAHDFREEMLRFKIEDQVTAAVVYPLAVRILYGQLLVRSAKTKLTNAKKRTIILAFLAGLPPQYLSTFFTLVLQPFKEELNAEDSDAMTVAVSQAALERKASHVQGFIHMVEDIMRQMGTRAESFLPQIISTVVGLWLRGEKETRKGLIEDMREIFRHFPAYDFSPWHTHLKHCLDTSTLPSACASASDPPALLRLLKLSAEESTLREWIFAEHFHPALVRALIDCINPATQQAPLEVVYDTISPLIGADNATLLEAENLIGLLDNLLKRVQSKQQVASRKEMALMTALADRFKEPPSGQGAVVVERLLSLLVPTLDSKLRRDGQDRRKPLLLTLNALLKHSPTRHKYIFPLSKLLGPFAAAPIEDTGTRAALIETFKSIGESAAHTILADMNAWDASRVGVYDYDKRLGAYERFSAMHDTPMTTMVPIVYQVLTDMHDQEYPIRGAAFTALVDFVLPLSETSESAMDRLMLAVVMPGIKHGIKSHSPQVRRGFIKLLAAVQAKVLLHAEWRQQPLLFPDLCVLVNTSDGEADFFANFVHLQAHRRVRALTRLRKQLPGLDIADNSVVHVLLPLVLHGVYESTKTTEQEYLKESIAMLGALAKRLSWSHYSRLLRQLVEQTTAKPLLRKPLLRAACAVIDNFHFDCSSGTKVLKALEQQMLPLLEKQLVGKKSAGSDREALYMPVVTGVVKLLNLLPQDRQAARVARLLRVVCNTLKSYDKDQRDEAREALCSILTVLGPSWLSTIVAEMQATLVEGYQLHVLSYSLYTVLKKTEPLFADELREARGVEKVADAAAALRDRKALSLAFDQALELIVGVLEKDLFGDVGRQRETSSGYKSKVNGLVEAKVPCGLKCYELAASLISFLPGASIHVLLKPLLTRLQDSDDVRTLEVVDACLKRVAAGVVKNVDVSIPHLLVYIHHLLTEPQGTQQQQQPQQPELSSASQSLGVSANWVLQHSANERLRAKEQQVKRRAYAGVHIVQAAPQLTGRDRFEAVRKRKRHAREMNRHVLLEHGLDLLRSAVRRVPPPLAEMLHPFPALLADVFIHTKASRAMVYSLRCFNELLKMDKDLAFPPETMEAVVQRVLQHIFVVLKDLTSVVASAASEQQRLESDSKQACVRTLTSILQRPRGEGIEAEKLELLVLLMEANIDVEEKQLAMFTLLKVLVRRQLVCPQMYDLMAKVSKQLFTSSRPQVRALAKQSLVHFLLHYPISNNRLEQHVSLIMSNLDFAVEDGRLAGLEMTKTILGRFPVEVVDALKDLIFFPLVLRLVNEPVPKCRAMVAAVLAMFLTKLEVNSFHNFFRMALGWMEATAEKNAPQLRLAGMQVLAIAVEHRSKDVTKTEVQEVTQALLLVTVTEQREWKVTYHAFLAMHKLAIHSQYLSCKELLMETVADGQHGKDIVATRMVDDHVWIRQASARLLGQFFAEVGDEAEAKSLMESEKDWLFSLVERSCLQLAGQELDASYVEQILKNLAWLIKAFVSNDDQRCINWLVHRLSYLGRDRDHRDRCQAVFKALAFLMTQLDAATCEQVLVPVLSPLYRARDTEPLAREVMELIEAKVSSPVYLRACTTVQQQITRIRETRKRARALENVVDPALNAQKKQKRQQQKREARKRKIQAKRRRVGR